MAQVASWLRPNHEVGYFRDCYNSYSLANWISQNIDETVRGGWGLEIFAPERPDFNTPAWRAELLSKSVSWLIKAYNLRGRETFVGGPSGTFLGFSDYSMPSPKSFNPCSSTICRPLIADSLTVEKAMFSFFDIRSKACALPWRWGRYLSSIISEGDLS